MTDQAQPTGQDKIIAALTALVEETRQSKIDLTDIAARQTQHTADIRDLSSGLATTRRALDPKTLGKHVADNNDAFMGTLTHKFARALDANAERDRELRDNGKNLQALTAKLTSETSLLAGLAARLEQRDARSKWDFVTLAIGMVVAALLAGGGAFFAAKTNIKRNDFQRSIQFITQDDDPGWATSRTDRSSTQTTAQSIVLFTCRAMSSRKSQRRIDRLG